MRSGNVGIIVETLAENRRLPIFDGYIGHGDLERHLLGLLVGRFSEQALEVQFDETVNTLLALGGALAQILFVGRRGAALDGRRHHADLPALLFEAGFHEVAGVHSPSKFIRKPTNRSPTRPPRRTQPATSKSTITASSRCRPRTTARR